MDTKNIISQNNNNNSIVFARNIILYWIIVIIIPFLVANFLKNKDLNFDFSGYLLLFIVFFGPIFFILPYKKSSEKLENKKNKFIFVLIGLIIPFTLIYLYLLYKIINIKGPVF